MTTAHDTHSLFKPRSRRSQPKLAAASALRSAPSASRSPSPSIATTPAPQRAEFTSPGRASLAPAVDARPTVDPNLLSYHVIPPRSAGIAEVALIGEMYRCWSESWSRTFLELDELTSLASDDFTRQDAIGGLFYGYECIGVTSFRTIDVRNPMDRADSYFASWPAAAVDAAAHGGPRICIASGLTVAAPWRKARGCSLKDLLVAMVVERFLASSADAFVGAMRNDRGMNRVGLRSGIQPLGFTIKLHGVDVDLMAFYRNGGERPVLDAETAAIAHRLAPQAASR